MNEKLEREVALAQLDHDFDELAGRATPPDRLDAILRQVAAGRQAAPSPRRSGASHRGRLLAAAVILLGFLVTIGVAMLQRDEDHQTRGDSTGRDSLFATAAQEAPGPGELLQPQGPPPKQDPEPAAKPKGNDPADLVVIRSVEAMLEAERRLARALEEGKLDGFDRRLTFDDLSGWKYEAGLDGMPEHIKGFAGKKVLMIGLMLPIDKVEDIEEFLLVPSLWSCCIGQPPDINGIVRCVMPKGETTDYSSEPLQIIGTFEVEATMEDGFCLDIYQLRIESVEAIK